MGDIIDEVYGVLQCKECSWYKSCVTPMKFTAEDIQRQIEAQNSLLHPQTPMDMGLQSLLAGMATSAQNSILEGCPVFIQRLRSNQKFAEAVKKLMREWGTQEPEG